MNDEETDERAADHFQDWKGQLKESLNEMVDALPQDVSLIASGVESQNFSEPSLEEFYRALIALEANTRKNVQKTNASLDLVSKNLRSLQVQLDAMDERIAKDERNDHESLIGVNGQFLRLIESLKSPPPSMPMRLSGKWEKAWSDLSEGVEILHRSIIETLREQGISIESPAIGSIFDPQTMEAVQVESTGGDSQEAVVVAVIEPAYYKNNNRIRNARVWVEK